MRAIRSVDINKLNPGVFVCSEIVRLLRLKIDLGRYMPGMTLVEFAAAMRDCRK